LPFLLQPIEALKGTDKFLEVPLRGTSKNLSRFYKSAKRCKPKIERRRAASLFWVLCSNKTFASKSTTSENLY